MLQKYIVYFQNNFPRNFYGNKTNHHAFFLHLQHYEKRFK